MKQLIFPLHFYNAIQSAVIRMAHSMQPLEATVTNDGREIVVALRYAPQNDQDLTQLVQFGIYIGTELSKEHLHKDR